MTLEEVTRKKKKLLENTTATEYLAVALVWQFAVTREAYKSFRTIYCSSEITKEQGKFTLRVGAIKTNKVKLHVHKLQQEMKPSS